MEMLGYIVRRFAFLVFVVAAISIMMFVISHIVPGDPARLAAGPHAQPAVIQRIRDEMGLNKPLWEQYLVYIRNLLRGDLGQSFRTHRPVLSDLLTYFPATIELAFTAILISIAIGVFGGMIAAANKDTIIDHAFRLFALSGVAMPAFWMGLLLLLFFHSRLSLFPSYGRIGMFVSPPRNVTGLFLLDSIITGNWIAFRDCLHHIVLPALTLSYGSLASIMRVTRSSVLEVLAQDYIRVARSKGLSNKRVLLKHALKNALISPLTLIGMYFGWMLSGSVMVEAIFGWPGVGQYALNAILFLDYNAIMGVTLLFVVIYVILNFVVDLAYAVLDPRITVGTQ